MIAERLFFMIRNQVIDIAKLICLVLMVFCHIPNPTGLFPIWVCSFHMPFFFILSGLFFKPEKFSLIKEIKNLILPYLIFNLLIVFISWTIAIVVTHQPLTIQDCFSPIFGILLGSNMKTAPYEVPIGPSWFLLALFWIRIMAYGLTSQKKCIAILLWVTLFCGYMLLERFFAWWLWSLNCAFLASGFFLFGYYFKDRVLSLLSDPKICYIVPIFFLLSILSVNNGLVNIHRGAFGDNIFAFFFFALCGTFFVLFISKYIHFPEKKLNVFIYGSIFIICMNMWLIDYLSLPYFKLIGNFDPLVWHQKIIVTALVFIVSFPCIIVLGKHVPWVLGRAKKIEI